MRGAGVALRGGAGTQLKINLRNFCSGSETFFSAPHLSAIERFDGVTLSQSGDGIPIWKTEPTLIGWRDLV